MTDRLGYGTLRKGERFNLPQRIGADCILEVASMLDSRQTDYQQGGYE
jgi:hypothetical protein